MLPVNTKLLLLGAEFFSFWCWKLIKIRCQTINVLSNQLFHVLGLSLARGKDDIPENDRAHNQLHACKMLSDIHFEAKYWYRTNSGLFLYRNNDGVYMYFQTMGFLMHTFRQWGFDMWSMRREEQGQVTALLQVLLASLKPDIVHLAKSKSDFCSPNKHSRKKSMKGPI